MPSGQQTNPAYSTFPGPHGATNISDKMIKLNPMSYM